MIESALATQWASMPDFSNRIASWTWFKNSVAQCLTLTAQRLNFRCELRNGDLAEAFFSWVAFVDNNQEFSKIDPIDFAHFACGHLLSSFIQAQPITVIEKMPTLSGHAKSILDELNWPDDLVLLSLTLTLLESWRLHLRGDPLDINLNVIKYYWNSFHENSREDQFTSIPFFDLFTGRPPVWGSPMTAGNRPAMRLALNARTGEIKKGGSSGESVGDF